MKLIIDIPEEKWKITQKRMYCNIFDLDMWYAIKKGVPLDDIKAEIKLIKEAELQIYGKESWNFVGKCLEIIDKHSGKEKE